MNRKRGSYVLKQFFCDDLTPLNVEIPESHAQGAHGSDPGCFSCHYKLDPISGFFHGRGVWGHQYAHNEDRIILFDDFAQENYDKYSAQWKDNEGFNLGYIRSTSDNDLNTIAKNRTSTGLKDLGQILRSSAQVKRCYVEKMFHYLVDKPIALDQGYLEELTNRFVNESKSSTKKAVQNLVTEIVTSRSFRVKSPQKGKCYDLVKGSDPDGPPCEVAAILKKNCWNCHSPKNMMGDLDLQTWKDGQFVKSGFQGNEIFQSMLERLNTKDDDLRMPLNTHMDGLEKAQLYKWLNQKVQK